ncbi:MAG: helix-turn-helix domain-containing protein [Candidatus Adlerbacteria bacterium]
MNYTEALGTLGLSEKQASVYLALVGLGESSAYAIAHKAGLKTPTTYVILKELIELNIVYTIPRAKKQLFVSMDPKQLFAKAQTRFEDAKSLLPSILALVAVPGVAPVTRSFSGKAQLLSAYFETLAVPDTTLRGWLSEGAWSEHGLDFFLNTYRPQRIKQNISNQFIVGDTAVMRDYAQHDAGVLKETRVDKNFGPQTDLLIYGGNKIIIASFYEEMGVIVESQKVHDLLAGIFEAHWAALEGK